MTTWSHHVAGSKDPGYVNSSHKWLKESEMDAEIDCEFKPEYPKCVKC